MSKTRLHNIWLTMRQRCNKPRCQAYRKYGAKNISVCDEWDKSFESFRDWALSNGYENELTLDRINCKGNYEPSNCRWVTQKVQQNNRSNNVHLTYHGKTLSIMDWANISKIKLTVLYDRYYRGWDVKRIFEQPVRGHRT